MHAMLIRRGRNLTEARSMGHAFRSLRHRNYRLFWVGQTASFAGNWMQIVAQSWLLLRLTDSPLALGALTAIQFAPVLALSLVAGVLADRLPKRRLLLITQSLMAVQSLTLAVLAATGHAHVAHLFVLTGLLGVVTAFDNPTRQAFQTELVPETESQNANALSNMQLNAARIVGPTLGAALLALFGPAGGFAANALSYTIMVGCLLQIRPAVAGKVVKASGQRALSQIGEGLRFVARTPDAVLVVVTVAALSGFGYNFAVVLPLIARDVLHAGATGFGLLAAAVGVGSMAGGLVMAQRGGTSRRLVAGSALAFSVALAGVALAPSWPAALALLAALGAPFAVFSVSANALLQQLAPPEMRGRVMSIYSLVVLGVTPMGSMVISVIAGAAGVHVAVGVAAAVCGLGAGGGLIVSNWVRARRTVTVSAPAARSDARRLAVATGSA